MLSLLSPAKTLNYEPVEIETETQPRFQKQTESLVRKLKKFSKVELMELMDISEKLAELNVERYQKIKFPFTTDNAKPAIFAFKGDVYLGLDAETLRKEDLPFAKKHLRILSGLYGVLNPLDLMQAYRLEMGTSLQINSKTSNLYEFWGNRITKSINEDLASSGSQVLINLASKEYFSAVKAQKIKGNVIHIHFKEDRSGKLKVISFNAKKARGRMARLIIDKKINQPEELKTLNVNDYLFRDDLSDDQNYVYIKC